MSNNPFEALGSLLDKLPDGPEQADEAPASSCKGAVRRVATLFYETKGRGGKDATIIEIGVDSDDNEMKELASQLKRRLGTGGSVRGNEILLQGDRRAVVRELLAKLGFRVKG